MEWELMWGSQIEQKGTKCEECIETLNIYKEIREHYSKKLIPPKPDRSCKILGLVLEVRE